MPSGWARGRGVAAIHCHLRWKGGAPLSESTQDRPKKSPYHEDTGVPELLLPRCADGIDETGSSRGGSRSFPQASHHYSLLRCSEKSHETLRLRLRLAAPLCILARRLRPRADITGDIAAQIPAWRGRGEFSRALALLPHGKRSRAVGMPVPALRPLLGESRCGNQ
jgi:hypothetical protein